MFKRNLVTALMMGSLYKLRRDRGLSTIVEISLPPGGCQAGKLAVDLGLPLEKISTVYCNHRIANLDHWIQPSDRVAFVPKDVPGPQNCFTALPKLSIRTVDRAFKQKKDIPIHFMGPCSALP